MDESYLVVSLKIQWTANGRRAASRRRLFSHSSLDWISTARCRSRTSRASFERSYNGK